MINWIQNTFHTDKWWGKTIFVALIYIIYWWIFYGIWFLIPERFFDHNSNLSGLLFLIYLCVLVPIVSFFIPHFIKKVFSTRHFYLLHILLIILGLVLFLALAAISAFSHLQIG